MVRRNFIMHTSLFVALLGTVAGDGAYAAVRIGNATRNNYYATQMAEQRAAQQFASINQVSNSTNDTTIATTERDIESLQDAKLSACSTIYPNGEFAIARPTAGIGIGAGNMCVAVVELRGYQMGKNGSDLVLARANVASGSSVKCNISEFPESSYTIDAQNVLFPADAEPTVQDVIKVMNQEQKQNAGLKIAAGALIGAVGGNLSGKNDIGKDGLFGTSKSQVTNTVVGAVGGAAIGAGGAYAGKVGGDMIMSTGINAAAGGVVGNIMAAGDSVLRIEKCTVNGSETSCLWGYLVTGPNLDPSPNDSAILCKNGQMDYCYKYFIDLDDGQSVFRCDANGAKCVLMNNLVSIHVNDGETIGGKPIENMERKDLDALKNGDAFYMAEDKTMVSGLSTATSHAYRLIESAKIDDGKKVPTLIAGFTDSAFGKKAIDWRTWKSANSKAPIYYRNGDGSIGDDLRKNDASITLENFYPMYINADDGGIIDLGNKARLKSTLIGAGAGGALGAFTAYQGAQDDIDARWVSAVREYKDSLQKFYCITGSRFLSYYNDMVIIPNINE